MRVFQKLVFHQSKCISAIKRILSTTTMYISSSSFMYLCVPCYCDACLKSSALRVGVKTLHNTMQLPTSKWIECNFTLCAKIKLPNTFTSHGQNCLVILVFYQSPHVVKHFIRKLERTIFKRLEICNSRWVFSRNVTINECQIYEYSYLQQNSTTQCWGLLFASFFENTVSYSKRIDQFIAKSLHQQEFNFELGYFSNLVLMKACE